MKRIRYVLIMLWALYSVPSNAQVSIQIGLPHVNIGINLPVYPELVVVPGYPVYYAPDLDANFFFYDGVYWVYHDDYWYESSWYNGPWVLVEPEFVPVFILRIPVFYYRRPPPYFHGWRSDEPPRWGDHWGRDWERHRRGWDKWDHNARHKPAPLPLYQREYSGERYPRQVDRQHELQQENYRFQPRDPAVRNPQQERLRQGEPAQQERKPVPGERGSIPQDGRRSTPRQQDAPAIFRTPSTQRGGTVEQRAAPSSPQQGSSDFQFRRQQPQPDAVQREKQPSQDRGDRQPKREFRQPDGEFRQPNGDAGRAQQRGPWQEKDRGRDR